ncbi:MULTISPECIES: fimbrial protein [Serratia]|uniref:Minor fimbrial protein prsF n=1 Tax=Serratia quinivorans TaxID=137545 RepID=A0A379ZZC5_9GAMM|nr:MULTISPECIES: fimbrial protein [Serratia]RYM63268.1 pilus assembly protein [Serratia proteamaculans]CAI1889905.1 Minor fimbrial protein prsF precursor [Serratia quinivorans]SUI70112.1 Minor fimbrial protein prsF precursor [Serratia quinivorans]
MIKNSGITCFAITTTLLLTGALSCGGLIAAENMTFSGTLVEPPPCTINNGERIDIDFGERVGVSKVDGVNYLQPVNYRITCSPGTGNWGMTLTLIGTKTGYDNAAVATNVEALGIQLRQAGKPFELNKPLTINLNNPPVLEAVPVKQPGVTLKEGAFEATATLQAVYQ